MNVLLHIPTSSRLQSLVSLVWEVRGGHDVQEIILPQGIIEVVFNFAAEISGSMPQRQTVLEAPRCFIQGIHTHSVHASYSGQQHLFGIRLHTYQVRDFLGVLPAELTNTTVDLSLVSRRIDRLWYQLVELGSFEERVGLLERELPAVSGDIGSRTRHLSDLFADGQAEHFRTVDELARQVCYSTRQLNRVAHELYGLSAEELSLYKKLTESVKCMHFTSQSLTEIAYTAGFYDQAHFCRVFKAYTGMTPNAYRKQKNGALPFHIIT